MTHISVNRTNFNAWNSSCATTVLDPDNDLIKVLMAPNNPNCSMPQMPGAFSNYPYKISGFYFTGKFLGGSIPVNGGELSIYVSNYLKNPGGDGDDEYGFIIINNDSKVQGYIGAYAGGDFFWQTVDLVPSDGTEHIFKASVRTDKPWIVDFYVDDISTPLKTIESCPNINLLQKYMFVITTHRNNTGWESDGWYIHMKNLNIFGDTNTSSSPSQNCTDFVFIQGTDSNKNPTIYYRQKTSDINIWNNWTYLGGYATSQPISAYFKDSVYVFIRGGIDSNNNYPLYCKTYNFNNSVWYPSGSSNWITLGGNLASYPVVVSDCILNNGMFVFYRGTDNTLKYRTTNGGIGSDIIWSNWINLGGTLKSEPACAFYLNTNNWRHELYTFHICSSVPYGCCYKVSSDGGGTWSSWTWLNYPSSSVSLTSDAPSCAAAFDGKLYIFCRGTDNAMYYKTFNSYNWSGWNKLQCVTISKPVSIPVGDKLYLFYKGQDKAIWGRYHDKNGWSNEFTLGGTLVGDPVAGSICRTLYIMHRGTDNALYYKTTDGINWDVNWIPLGGTAYTDASMAII